MRRILLTVNQIINDREAEKARMAYEEEQEQQRLKSISNATIKATRASKRQERKIENDRKIATGNLRRSARLNQVPTIISEEEVFTRIYSNLIYNLIK